MLAALSKILPVELDREDAPSVENDVERIGAHVKQLMRDKRLEHKQYIYKRGDDMPEVRDWKWPY